MLTHHAPQGTPAWLSARAGVVTASMFKVARSRLKRGGGLTAEAEDYAFRCAVERIGGAPLDEGHETWQMRRGIELEPEARAAHQEHAGVIVEPAHFVTTDDGRFGATPDGLIGRDGGAEYKCLIGAESLRKVLSDANVGAYMDQVQGGMWITGRRWWDLCIYCPALAPIGLDLVRYRINRDPEYIAALVADLREFDQHVTRHEQQLRRLADAMNPFSAARADRRAAA